MPFPDQMMPTPPSVPPNRYALPVTFVLGDSFEFRFRTTLFPPTDGWSMLLSLRGQGVIDIDSSVDGGDYLLAATNSETSAWEPGEYQAQLYAQKTGRRETVLQATMTVLISLEDENADVDLRSDAQKTLDLIDALLQGRATNDIIESVIDQTRFTRMTFSELLKARSYFITVVRKEKAQQRVKAGMGSGRNIFARFTNPT